VIIPDNEKSKSVRQEVAQLTSKVAQPETKTSIESRLLALESKIYNIFGLIFSNQNLIEAEKKKVGSGRFEHSTSAV
jgi:hypothetical protein